jgi:hypothetical protein
MMPTAFYPVKIVALTLFQLACFAAAGWLLVRPPDSATTQRATEAAWALLAVCFLNTLVLAYLTVRSHWSGIRLMLVVFVPFYGVMTVMSQIESAIFLRNLPQGLVARFFLMGALVAAPFSIASVLLLKGRASATRKRDTSCEPFAMGRWGAVQRSWFLAVAHVGLYFVCGYFLAWRSAEVRQFYGVLDKGSCWAQMVAVLRDQPWLIPVQLARGGLWVVLAWLVVRMLKRSRMEAAFATGLLFLVVMNAQLLLPNPYLPDTLRWTHLVETPCCNLLFGCLSGWVLSPTRVEGHAKAGTL